MVYNDASGYVELEAAPAPEPSSLLLLGSGLLTIGYGMRRRRDQPLAKLSFRFDKPGQSPPALFCPLPAPDSRLVQETLSNKCQLSAVHPE